MHIECTVSWDLHDNATLAMVGWVRVRSVAADIQEVSTRPITQSVGETIKKIKIIGITNEQTGESEKRGRLYTIEETFWWHASVSERSSVYTRTFMVAKPRIFTPRQHAQTLKIPRPCNDWVCFILYGCIPYLPQAAACAIFCYPTCMPPGALALLVCFNCTSLTK